MTASALKSGLPIGERALSIEPVGPAAGWWQDAVIYELPVRAFADSNGDGIGDLPGLIGRLDYLQDLGVTAIWLLPFYPSPHRDGGYDIADYRKIHPAYGDLRSFRRLMDEAHRRGLRVITELVFNHTSDQHPWFQRSRRAPAGSRWRDFYVWSDTPELYREARVIFQDFESSNWSWDPVAGAYFWHRFYSHQPDLNYDNPEVEAEMFSVVDHWLAMGVDGVRLDAIPYLYERDGTTCENLPETHAFLRRLRAHIDERFEGRMLLAEANQWPEDAAAYFGAGDECHLNYHFPLMPRLYMALRQENRLPVVDILDQTPALPAGCSWATFLRNHDELTLEMVSDEERDYMYRAYATDPMARLNLGIRRRLAPLLGNDRRKIELLNALLFSLPGTPVLYYGDEIGMGDNLYLGDRDGVRTPMQWSADRNGGFSRAPTPQLYLPPIADGSFRYETVNVEVQEGDPHSLLSWMRQLIAVRRRLPVLTTGALTMLEPDNHRVLAFTRERSGAVPVLVVANLSHRAQPVELDLRPFAGSTPVEVFGRTAFPPIGESPYSVTLAPHGFYWFELAPSDVPNGVSPERVVPHFTGEVTTSGRPNRELTAAVCSWLVGRRWFGGTAEQVDQCVLSIIGTEESTAVSPAIVLAIATVAVADGDTERYFVPLAALPAASVEPAGPVPRSAVVAMLDDEQVLVDAVADAGAAVGIARILARTRRPNGVVVETDGSLRRSLGSVTAADVRILGAEQSNSSFVVAERVIVKVLRRLPGGTSVDAEVSAHLDGTGFTNHSPYLGSIGHRHGGGVETLALANGYVLSEGDAWNYALDRLDLQLDDPDAALGELGATGPELELLGRRLGQLHVALARSDGEGPFAPEPFTRHAQRALYQSMRTQLRSTLSLLRRRRSALPADVRAVAEEVLGASDLLLARLDRLRTASIESCRIRIHGDLHLGQILYTGRDFVFIDFEGEPDRSLTERRVKRSPVTDVAGLLRSMDYAVQFTLDRRVERGLTSPSSAAAVAHRAGAWRDAATAQVVAGYVDEVAVAPGLLPDLENWSTLLELFVLEKAIYELRYELGHRPGWVGFPLAALAAAARRDPSDSSVTAA